MSVKFKNFDLVCCCFESLVEIVQFGGLCTVFNQCCCFQTLEIKDNCDFIGSYIQTVSVFSVGNCDLVAAIFNKLTILSVSGNF